MRTQVNSDQIKTTMLAKHYGNVLGYWLWKIHARLFETNEAKWLRLADIFLWRKMWRNKHEPVIVWRVSNNELSYGWAEMRWHNRNRLTDNRTQLVCANGDRRKMVSTRILGYFTLGEATLVCGREVGSSHTDESCPPPDETIAPQFLTLSLYIWCMGFCMKEKNIWLPWHMDCWIVWSTWCSATIGFCDRVKLDSSTSPPLYFHGLGTA